MARAELRVEVVCCAGPNEVDRVELSIAPGATVLDALRASGLRARYPELPFGVWGHVVAADALLRDGDRVELYRPLLVDPKESRRERARRQRRVR